jgi:ABC-type polysaccharide/polyol phosphate transport system ATPase subunit
LTAIEVDHLVKRFGCFTAVEDISFDVPADQVAAVLGPNGAGKTTTIEVLEGFLAPSHGAVRASPPIRRRLPAMADLSSPVPAAHGPAATTPLPGTGPLLSAQVRCRRA